MKGKKKWLAQGEYQEGKQQQKEKKEREKKKRKGFPDRAGEAAGPTQRRHDKSKEMQMSSQAPPSHPTPMSGCQQIQKAAWGEDSGDTDEVEV